VKFDEPGDDIIGTIVEFDLETGGKTFDGDDCGFATLEDRDGELWTVTLDKGALRDAFTATSPVKGKLVRLVFAEWRQTKDGKREYKHFKGQVPLNQPKDLRSMQAAAKEATQVAADDEAPF
jgi:hypothetical protein